MGITEVSRSTVGYTHRTLQYTLIGRRRDAEQGQTVILAGRVQHE